MTDKQTVEQKFGPFTLRVTPRRVDIEDAAVGCLVFDHRTSIDVASAILALTRQPPVSDATTVKVSSDEVQQLMERGLLHFTDDGWTLGDVWADYRASQVSDEQLREALLQASGRLVQLGEDVGFVKDALEAPPTGQVSDDAVVERVARVLNKHFGVGNEEHWIVYCAAARAAIEALSATKSEAVSEHRDFWLKSWFELEAAASALVAKIDALADKQCGPFAIRNSVRNSAEFEALAAKLGSRAP
jgi:hypothetical protein